MPEPIPAGSSKAGVLVLRRYRRTRDAYVIECRKCGRQRVTGGKSLRAKRTQCGHCNPYKVQRPLVFRNRTGSYWQTGEEAA